MRFENLTEVAITKLEEGNKIFNISTNYHISVKIALSADGRLVTVSFESKILKIGASLVLTYNLVYK